jgi:type II secretory pathway pseudopilin PulG
MTMKKRRGITLIEVIVATGILVIAVAASAYASLLALELSVRTADSARAAALNEEGIDAAVSIRDRSWNEMVDGNHGLAIDGTPRWTFSGNSSVVDGFTRVVTVSTYDTNTKKVTSTVSWNPKPNQSASLESTTLLTKWPFL